MNEARNQQAGFWVVVVIFLILGGGLLEWLSGSDKPNVAYYDPAQPAYNGGYSYNSYYTGNGSGNSLGSGSGSTYNGLTDVDKQMIGLIHHPEIDSRDRAKWWQSPEH